MTGLRALVAAAATVAMASAAFAQAYPNKPITVVVPFAAGGPTDIVARLLGEHMSRTLGQTMVVENVGGAGGTTGMARVAAAAPDGYTIAVGNLGTLSAAPALYPNLKYEPAKSFQHIGVANFAPMVFIGAKTMAAGDMKAFVDHLKANPGKLNYGHAGVGSISYVAGVVFNGQQGTKANFVAYRGTGPALNDLVGGQLDFMIDQATNNIPQIQAGNVKGYAVTAAKRLGSLPNVPTTKEAGFDFEFSAWNAMVAPAGIPKEVTDKLADALDKAQNDATILKRFDDLGSTAPQGADRGPAGLKKLIEAEMARFTPMLKSAPTSVEKK